MEGFGLVSKRGRRIYKDGLFPSKWSRFATTNYLTKDFETSHFPEPTSVWLKTPLSPFRSPRLGRGDFSLPSTMSSKGKKTSRNSVRKDSMRRDGRGGDYKWGKDSVEKK